MPHTHMSPSHGKVAKNCICSANNPELGANSLLGILSLTRKSANVRWKKRHDYTVFWAGNGNKHGVRIYMLESSGQHF